MVRRENFESTQPDIKDWKARYEDLTREEARKRLAFSPFLKRSRSRLSSSWSNSRMVTGGYTFRT